MQQIEERCSNAQVLSGLFIGGLVLFNQTKQTSLDVVRGNEVLKD